MTPTPASAPAATNGGGRTYNPGQYGNDIVYGNVSGGKQFRGAISSFNPYNFQGTTSGLATGPLHPRVLRHHHRRQYLLQRRDHAALLLAQPRPQCRPRATPASPTPAATSRSAASRRSRPTYASTPARTSRSTKPKPPPAPTTCPARPTPTGPTAPSTRTPTAPGFRPGETAAGGRIDLRDRTAADILSPYTHPLPAGPGPGGRRSEARQPAAEPGPARPRPARAGAGRATRRVAERPE